MSFRNEAVWGELAEHARLPFEQACMLPPAAYTSTDVLAEEHRRIFSNEWMCIGRTADLPNTGDYLTAEIPSDDSTQPGAHRSVIALRDDKGTIAVFDNICAHRGSPLLEGCGNEARITCPYHAWVYRLDGQLIGAPYMSRTVDSRGKAFDAGDHHLTSLRLEEWEGFLFVTHNPAAEDLGPRLAALGDVVGRYRMAGYVPVHRQVDVWDTNWKLLYENFMDAYHVFKVHKNSFAKNDDNTLLTTMHAGDDHCAYHRVGHDANATSGVAHPANTSLEGEWRRTIVLGAAFPTHVMQLQPDWLWYLQLSPLGVGRVRIRWDVSVAPEVLADQPDADAYVAKLLDLLNLVNAEDRPIVEGVFRGVHRSSLTRGPLSYLERNVYDFDRYIARSLTGERNAADRNRYESITGTKAPYPSLMIKLSVSYPKGEGTTFDHKYYAATHIPLCNSTFNPAKTEVEKGIDGPNVAGVTFYFDSMEAMQRALGSPQMADVMADVSNYTNIAPVMQVSEVVS